MHKPYMSRNVQYHYHVYSIVYRVTWQRLAPASALLLAAHLLEAANPQSSWDNRECWAERLGGSLDLGASAL